VTPWFAAATGFVIAAGLWVYAPHTVLRFPSSEPGLSLCKSAGCVQDPDPQGGGNLAVASPGVKIRRSEAGSRRAARPGSRPASTAAAGLKFTFTVLWRRHDGFGASISVSGHQVPGSWRLSFRVPGAQIAYVTGVTWQANSDGSGGTASAPDWQSGTIPWYGGGSADNGPGAGHTTPDSAAPVISFLITGSGPAHRPAHCVFDGGACRFG